MPRNHEEVGSLLVDQIVQVARREGLSDLDFVAACRRARAALGLRGPTAGGIGAASYINRPTERLATDVEGLVRRRGDLRESDRVTKALRGFERICRRPPAIVEYVLGKTDPEGAGAGFTRDQIKLVMLSVVARSSSTWGTIQAEAALLSLAGDHDVAAVINANAMNETGDKDHRPHSLLLFDGFAALGEGLQVEALTPASYHLVRHIHRLRRRLGDGGFADAGAIAAYLRMNRICTRYTPLDMQVALGYCDISDPAFTRYHSQTLRDVLGLEDLDGIAPPRRNPYDSGWKALRLLELAVREASSVDEDDTGKLSYIGAWGMVVDSMLGHVPPAGRERALAWTRAHNDEATGQSAGWQGAAEDGHADDARGTAMDVLKTLDAETFARTLRGVAKQGNARLAFWDHVVAALESRDHAGERIPIKKAMATRPTPAVDSAIAGPAVGTMAAPIVDSD